MISLAIPRIELGTRAEARTKEVERALAMKADYILFLDTDQTMPDNALEEMLKLNAEIAIIDTPPHDSEAENFRYNPDGTIAYCTMACSLIKSDVFGRVDKPWFSSAYDFIDVGIKEGRIIFSMLNKSKDNNVGEDIYFIRKCVEANIEIKKVSNLKCLHFQL